MPLKLRYSLDADADIAELTDYTLGAFGAEQAMRYIDGLTAKLESLCIFPELGRARLELGSNIRQTVYGSHTVYYEMHASEIFVLRVYGPGQKHLPRSAPETRDCE